MMVQNQPTLNKLFLVLFAIALGAVVGYVDLVSEEVQLPALLLLGSAFILGLLSPRLAWLWAAMLGLSIITAHGVGYLFNLQLPYQTSLVPMIVLPLMLAAAGAFAGVFLRGLFGERAV